MNTKWINRFMNMAREVSLWSKDPSTKIGAVCVRDRRIISTGYNGFPEGILDTEERLNDRSVKYEYVVHGELNAILNAAKFGVSLEGASIFVYGLPTCINCAKAVIQSGIKEVYYHSPNGVPEKWETEFKTSMKLFIEAGLLVEEVVLL